MRNNAGFIGYQQGRKRWKRALPFVTFVLALGLSGCAQISAIRGSLSGGPRTGPAGLAFYNPPSPLPAGRHGQLIWVRPLNNEAALPSASKNWLVLYLSTDINGQPVAVSGTVAVPKGTPPEGGWPVISWAHGTTGTADICAPSRDDGPSYPDYDYISRINKTLDVWVKNGYALLQTDYQGLGTPGPHPYLIGDSEARGVVDIVLAARQLVPDLSTKWVVMGHSQGGGAAVFTAGLAPLYAPDLRLEGAVAIAPASHLDLAMKVIRSGKSPGGMPFLPLALNGAAAASPAVLPDQLLTPLGQQRLELADQRCLAGLRASDAWGGLTPAEAFRADANFGPLDSVLNDEAGTEHVHVAVPLLVLQATNDRIVPKVLTDPMVTELCDLGATLEYRTYTINPLVGPAGSAAHRGTVEASLADAEHWVADRFAGKAAQSTCRVRPHASH
jgi:pimeloyl-ACP methyl ester carboxylesterase